MKKGHRTTPMTVSLLWQVCLGHPLQRSLERYEQEFRHQSDHTTLVGYLQPLQGFRHSFSRACWGITI